MLGNTAHIIAIASMILLPSTTLASPLDHTPKALTARSLNTVADSLSPKAPGTAGQIQCYSLPYGAIGFISHILTYWTLICIMKGKQPLLFWKPLTWKWWGVWLAALMLALTIAISVWTIVRCRADWRVLVIAVWKLTMSATLGCVCLHRALMMERDVGGKGYHPVEAETLNIGSGEKTTKVPWQLLAWLPLYGCGIIVGMSGLISLVHHNWHNHLVQLVTVAFAGVIFGTAVVFAALVLCSSGGGADAFFVGSVVGVGTIVSLIGVLSAFYSDWILAAVMGNMVGQPSSDIAPLYWTYFVAKRLPLFSI
jgi:hypothetical protein